ncbi:MAG TPA: outer membrane beta-barrel protein [Edaphobacter sp.]|nr:outer membrane beta-barrel protein [Edaphobacter sp.]
MKKTMLLGALMLMAVAGFAQESRQDASVSAIGVFGPQVNGNAVQLNSTGTVGFLGSYRYMLTPRSALELNYGFAQNSIAYRTSFLPNGRVHTRQQEISGAYVYNMNFRNFNPFLEAGVGGMIFTPIRDSGTTLLDTKQNTNIGALFGGGVAYELSPSFDIRVQYRGFVVKAPDFGLTDFKTNRYQVISMPALGVAYHF